MDRQPRLVVAVALCVALFVVRAWPSVPTVVDDAWISARYAVHLALGNGLVYNAGEAPIEGYTNLAFVVLLAALWRVGVDMHAAMVGSGLVFGAIGIVATTGLARTLAGRPSVWLALPGLLLALDPHYAVVASNGIESSMFVAVVLSACWATFATTGRGRVIAAALVALVVAVRPEGVAVAAALVLHDLVAGRDRWRRPETWATTVGLLAGVVPVWLGRWLYFGAWVPNTFAAKAHKDLVKQIEFDLRYLAPDGSYWGVVAVLLGLGLVLAVASRDLRRLIAGAIALGLVLVAFRVDLWMPGGRLLLPSVALTIALAGSWLPALAARHPALPAPLLLLGLPLLFGSIPKHVHRYDSIHSALPGNGAELAARHLGAHAPPGAVLATRDAGVLAYHVGPHVQVAELHQRALTRPHPDGGDARVREYTPRNPELFIATVQREKQPRSKYGNDGQIFRRLDASYDYLGRVHQHHHRYYDVYARSDLGVPPLPESLVVNRLGPTAPEGAPKR